MKDLANHHSMFLSYVRAIFHLCLPIALYLNILGHPVIGKDAKASLTVTAVQPQLHGQSVLLKTSADP